MEERDVVETIRKFIAKGFPKICTCCGRRYESLADYLRNTQHVGKPVSFDAEEGNWRPQSPVGTLSLANCSCGTTMAIGSHGMNLLTMWKLMRWAKRETKLRNIKLSDLLDDIRNKIDKAEFEAELEAERETLNI